MAAGAGATLGTRALNRAVLERQWLLRRSSRKSLAAVEHLVGLQAQAPFPPYTGLWTRLDGFDPEELARLLVDRAVVRTAMMRGTVHLVGAEDCLALRPLLHPMMRRLVRNSHGRQLAGLDLDDITAWARRLVEDEPLSTTELTRRLGERWPGHDPRALMNHVRAELPLVQLPPRAVWGRAGRTVVTTAQAWLGRPLAEQAATPDSLVLRYLAAFGPATVADAQRWSGLTGLAEVVERLGPRLRVFRDETGAELFDLPEAPRPDPSEPAPVRFVPEYDNLLLAYADNARVIAPEHRRAVMTANGIIRATVLVDGFVQAFWKVAERSGSATLHIEPLRPLSPAERTAVEEEGARLLGFLAPGTAGHDLRFTVAAPAGR